MHHWFLIPASQINATIAMSDFGLSICHRASVVTRNNGGHTSLFLDSNIIFSCRTPLINDSVTQAPDIL